MSRTGQPSGFKDTLQDIGSSHNHKRQEWDCMRTEMLQEKYDIYSWCNGQRWRFEGKSVQRLSFSHGETI